LPDNKKTVSSGTRAALCGIIAALSCVFMFATFIPAGEYALPAIAGIVLAPIVIELGIRSGLMSYAASALVTLILPINIEPKLLYILFFGYYPILKAALESRFPRPVEWMIKLAVFNTAMIASYTVLAKVFAFDIATMFVVGGVSIPWLILLAGNGVFVIFDIAITNILSAYIRILSPVFRKMFRLK